ncbi:NAD(P)H-dependent oxidoreductase subunit E [Synechococcus sp. CS-1325]|uniref:NAD(P)H-dependent oxidoreductase subunit E n=1 Tax=Synechococcus sp. CS-1325 TaxID=2847979 RepID=UPI000DB4B2DE|nr:NAD(P)H-dependent oxidoreductase subunit E [Synechococcus sp. CS-1325]MCT0198338.1 NAD(P)H-dependent oxidoreductase subunit E [Synechococcus sp. CS-1325]PZV00197.1 MAG: hydrogenase HoxE [Cyanobium sp.]
MPTATFHNSDQLAAAAQPFEALQPILLRHHRSPDSLIEILNQAQQFYGYLSVELLRHVARSLALPDSQVFGTATFYHLFRFQPPARHSCVVCTGTACEVNGAAQLVAALEGALRISLGARRSDGFVSLGAVRCLGTCSAAPVLVIDGVVMKHQSAASALATVRELAP